VLKTFWTIFVIWLCGWGLSVSAAETYSLTDGSTLNGDILTFNDTGVKFRLGEDKYSDMIPWPQFSQESLKQLAQNPKLRSIVEPFIALPPVEHAQPTDNIKLHEVSRLERPARHSLLGALGSSSVGCFLLALIYLANLYAAWEVAACRGRPIAAVLGLAAVLPVVGPAVFYFLPTLQLPGQTESVPAVEGEAASAPGTSGAPSAPSAPSASSASSISSASSVPAASGTPGGPGDPGTPVSPDPSEFAGLQIQVTAAAPAASEPTVLQVYKRGQFTFNRRFIETKFAGFFPAVRSEADQKLDFIVKLSQGTYVVERIANIGLNDVQFVVVQDGQSLEVLAPLGDIQEITLKSKTA
jgi:hypothetical protein